jgi:hypothetical protein
VVCHCTCVGSAAMPDTSSGSQSTRGYRILTEPSSNAVVVCLLSPSEPRMLAESQRIMACPRDSRSESLATFSNQNAIPYYVIAHQIRFVVYERVHPCKSFQGVLLGL